MQYSVGREDMRRRRTVSLRRTAGLNGIKLNTQAMNAASRVVGEVRRTLGTRAAADALPAIFAKVGIRIARANPTQGELNLKQPR